MMGHQSIGQWDIWNGFLYEKLKNKNRNEKKLLQFYPQISYIFIDIFKGSNNCPFRYIRHS